MNKNEIIIYQSNELAEHIEVRIDDETVWLSLNQIAQLFCRDKSVISRHLRNIFKDGELVFETTVAKNATVQIEAGREVKREIEYYNLDAILSVGYRVNSKQGTQFRIWATNVLRDYLLKGYALNQRMNRIENNVEQYGNFEIKEFTKSHDRFLIIDDSEVFHLGASLKDLGKKWFAFSQLNKNSVESILKSINHE